MIHISNTSTHYKSTTEILKYAFSQFISQVQVGESPEVTAKACGIRLVVTAALTRWQ